VSIAMMGIDSLSGMEWGLNARLMGLISERNSSLFWSGKECGRLHATARSRLAEACSASSLIPTFDEN